MHSFWYWWQCNAASGISCVFTMNAVNVDGYKSTAGRYVVPSFSSAADSFLNLYITLDIETCNLQAHLLKVI